jgi:hypothetical protein
MSCAAAQVQDRARSSSGALQDEYANCDDAVQTAITLVPVSSGLLLEAQA